MDNEIDRKIDVTAILFLLVQNRQQTHDWILIGSGANGLGIQECLLANSVSSQTLKPSSIFYFTKTEENYLNKLFLTLKRKKTSYVNNKD